MLRVQGRGWQRLCCDRGEGEYEQRAGEMKEKERGKHSDEARGEFSRDFRTS